MQEDITTVNQQGEITIRVSNKGVNNIKFLTMELRPSEEYEIVSTPVEYVGKIDSDLLRIEQQLRDYNRNNTAQFSIITDGRKWRFYYSQTGGEFSHKCFTTSITYMFTYYHYITLRNKKVKKITILNI